MICQQMYPKFLQKRKINTTGLVFVTMLSLGMLAHVTREHCWNFLNVKIKHMLWFCLIRTQYHFPSFGLIRLSSIELKKSSLYSKLVIFLLFVVLWRREKVMYNVKHITVAQGHTCTIVWTKSCFCALGHFDAFNALCTLHTFTLLWTLTWVTY